MEDTGQSWLEYRRLILAELERLSDEVNALSKAHGELKTAVALLKLRAGLWGALSGMIPVSLYLALKALTAR